MRSVNSRSFPSQSKWAVAKIIVEPVSLLHNRTQNRRRPLSRMLMLAAPYARASKRPASQKMLPSFGPSVERVVDSAHRGESPSDEVACLGREFLEAQNVGATQSEEILQGRTTLDPSEGAQ